MKCAAMVRIKEDMDKLNLWLSYYSKYFDKIWVLCCQTPEGATIPLRSKYKFEEIYTDVHIHSMEAHQIVFSKQVEALESYDWFLYADSDEYVVPTSSKINLRQFMALCKKNQTFCEGYEVVMCENENRLNYGQPILAQRKMWFRDESGSYNKPALSRVKTEWVEGFHQIRDMTRDEVVEIKDTGLYMIHLNHINDIMNDRKLVPIPEWIRKVI